MFTLTSSQYSNLIRFFLSFHSFGSREGMAMTLQGSVLTNGNTATNFVPLKLEPNNKDSPEVFLNEASNGFGDCEKNGLNNGEVIEEVKETPSEEPVIDITINNVVCSFSVKSHLNLKQIAQSGYNVEYRRENGVRFSHSLKSFSQFLDFNLHFCCRW